MKDINDNKKRKKDQRQIRLEKLKDKNINIARIANAVQCHS